MITSMPRCRERPEWQRELALAITDPAELIDTLHLDPGLLPAAHRAARAFGLRVPRGFAARMRVGDPRDPLLRQVLPLEAETRRVPGFDTDPLGEGASLVSAGVLSKYHGRALVIATGACAVHCRYCFRRHFPYQQARAATAHWSGALAELARDPELTEVILSGGDPLALADHKLAEFAAGIERLGHVRRLRIHTRLPVVLPGRVDEGLSEWLGALRLQKVVVLHANHANEIDSAVASACAALARCGVTLLNQSVVLRGVNDSARALVDLSEALFGAGVLPYYLHLLDPVAGAAHFDVPQIEAAELVRQAAGRLPGYLVPRLVREVPGAPAKMAVTPAV